jgi:hypothetical protein
MNQYVKCSQCKTRNELKSLFCVECGAKLDMKSVRLDRFSSESGVGSGILRVVLKLVRNILLLAILAAIGLMAWPPSPKGEVGGDVLAWECGNKLARLQEACKRGIGMQSIFEEAEMNAYLAQMIGDEGIPGEEGATSQLANLSDLVLTLYEDTVEVVTTMKLGPVPLSYVVEGRPSVEGDAFVFEIVRASVGHLPMPGPISNFVGGKTSRVFSGMEAEMFILNHLSEVEMKARRIRVTTGGATGDGRRP